MQTSGAWARYLRKVKIQVLKQFHPDSRRARDLGALGAERRQLLMDAIEALSDATNAEQLFWSCRAPRVAPTAAAPDAPRPTAAPTVPTQAQAAASVAAAAFGRPIGRPWRLRGSGHAAQGSAHLRPAFGVSGRRRLRQRSARQARASQSS